MLVLIVIALCVCGWAGWLARSAHAAHWMRAVAAFSAASMVGVVAYWVWKVDDLFATLSAVTSAAERQRVLSEGLARAYTILAVVGAAVLVAMAALSVMVRSRAVSSRGR